MQQKAGSSTLISTVGATLDAKAHEKVRDILHQLANAVSAMKIFPSEHASTRTFANDLTQKFRGFLDAHGKLELWISEFSFITGDKAVYEDDIAIKSLPFFFYKDGMQRLYFYQGLDGAEISDFLEVIRREARKPAGDSDIVSAMWERDFSHIQYYAPEDFLENRILEEFGQGQSKASSPDASDLGQKAVEIKIDTSKFSQGKIELTEEDREIVQRRAADQALAREEAPRVALDRATEKVLGPEQADAATEAASEPSKPEGPEKAEGKDGAADGGEGQDAEAVTGEGGEPASPIDLTLTDPEAKGIEALVASSRAVSPDEEFLNLMVEVLNLEEDLETLATNLDVLMEYQRDQLQQGNFRFSVLLVVKLRELRDHLAAAHPGKAARIETFLKRISGGRVLDIVKNLLEQNQPVDWDSLVDFIRLLGPAALPVAADIYESVPVAESQQKVLEFIRTSNAHDPAALANLAADERPRLSRAILEILCRDFGRKGLTHFAVFLGFKDKDIKREAIRVLGEAHDEMANRLLLGFLNDKDEDIRIEALFKIDPGEVRSRVNHLIQEASSRAFRVKSMKEKQAVLTFLGRTRTEAALGFLRKTLGKRMLWPSVGKRDSKLAAVQGLEIMGTDEAVAVLEKGARSWSRAVRQAAAGAVDRLKQKKAGAP
jgi:HEAT repeat protein